MSVDQQWRPQMSLASPKPTAGDGSLDQDLVLNSLNLHGTAINTALKRLQALERQAGEQQAKPSPTPNRHPATPNWLEAVLKRRGPEDGKAFIYFLHIPKTSGLSFRCFLADAFGEDNVAPFRDWDAVLSYSGAANNWRVWSGHFGGILPFILPSWPRIVTILRDPVNQTISHINHIRRESAHPFHHYAKGMSVLELCHHPRFRYQIDNYQARHLASLAFPQVIFRNRASAITPVAFMEAVLSMDPQCGLLSAAIRVMSELDMVGIAEAHNATLRLFAHIFNVPAPSEAYHINKADQSQLKRANLSPEELECIQELTQIDRLVYDCARKRFENECQRAKITPQLQ